MKRFKKCFALLICIVMLISVAACTQDPTPGPGEETTTGEESTAPGEEQTAPGPEQPPEPVKDAIEAMKDQLIKIQKEIGAATDTVLYAKDFGAVGDGKTDDGAAIYAAVTEAIRQHATLVFEQNKTYYIASVPGNRQTPFVINGADGVSVDGGNSTFLMAPGMCYFQIDDSKNIKLSNCHFDLAVTVYLVGKVKSVQDNVVVFDVDTEPHQSHVSYPNNDGFSIAYNEGLQQRPHTFISQMQKTGDKEVTVTYTSHTYKPGQTVYLPNPGIGHVGNAVCEVKNNTGCLLIENVGIHAAPVFCWNIGKNRDKIFFENVDLVPAENNQREIKMVSWRDGFHCKDNAGSLHWNNCEADVLFDDVYNIANTLGEVTASENNNTFTVRCYESAGQTFVCSPGDTIDIYELNSGYYMGSGRVRSVRINADGTRTLTLYYGQAIDKVVKGCLVANRDTGAPGSTITNCHFQGTFRFMRSLYVENTVFDMLQTWIMVSGSVEGPIPGNMDFVNCTFNGGNIQIDALNYYTSKRLTKIGQQIKDIGYWGCTFNNSDIKTRTNATYTVSEQYTTDTLYTVQNANLVNDPVTIAPTDADVKTGVTWDWTLFTMPMSGDLASLTPIRSLAQSVQPAQSNQSGNVLALQAAGGEKLYFDGLSASALPCLYQKGSSYMIRLTYYAQSPVKAKLVIGGTTVSEDLFTTTGKWTTVSLIHHASSNDKITYIECMGDGTVYLGDLTLATFTNANPSVTQLEQGHTFIWDGNVRIGSGTAIKTADAADQNARKAMLENPEKFGDTVLLLSDQWGDFNGLTKKANFAAGTTYRISIDAYIASPLPAGAKLHLVAQDGTQSGRIIKQDVFHGQGLYHLELDWRVGSTGERLLTFVLDGAAADAEIYLGNLTITKLPPLTPQGKLTISDYTYPTVEQLEAGFTFDFSKGILFDVGQQNYVDTSCLNDYAAQTLKDAGFGEYAYYYSATFDGLALGEALKQRPGRPITITMVVYDCQGNLPTAPLGALTLLNMSDGLQNSAGCDYVLTPDPTVPGLYTMTFKAYPPAGTDTLRFYVLEPCSFYIASVTVDIQ